MEGVLHTQEEWEGGWGGRGGFAETEDGAGEGVGVGVTDITCLSVAARPVLRMVMVWRIFSE